MGVNAKQFFQHHGGPLVPVAMPGSPDANGTFFL
jgi:hypothetical protein